MNSPIEKHSVTLHGKETSVSLEKAFWSALERIAKNNKMTIQELIEFIDDRRLMPNLSSHLRTYAFQHDERGGDRGYRS